MSVLFFAAASLLSVHLKKCFSFLFQYFFVIKFYVSNNFFSQYKHKRPTAAVIMKAAHNVLYMKKHIQNVRFIYCDGHQLYYFKERGVYLELSGGRARYNYEDASWAAYVLGPPPSTGGDLELRAESVSL